MSAAESIVNRVVRGEYLLEGYIQDLAPKRFAITIVDGRAFDADALALPIPDTEPLVIHEDGSIGEPGYRWSFLPEDGELDRIGREHFAEDRSAGKGV